MAELAIQISGLPARPSLPSPTTSSPLVNPSANATGSLGFKLSLLAPRKPSLQCCLVFRNFYVAWLRIVQVNVDGSSTELAAAYPLMQHVHCEDDAENWQHVKLDHLPAWELRDVKLFELPQVPSDGGDSPLAATLLGSASPGRNGSNAANRLTLLLKHRVSHSMLAQRAAGADTAAISVEDQAVRYLELVLRLRELLLH